MGWQFIIMSAYRLASTGTLQGKVIRRVTILVLLIAFVAALLFISTVKGNEASGEDVLDLQPQSGYECYENIIALTFDDGPRRSTTAKLLDGLQERGVKATFFLVGKNIEGNEEIIKRMRDEGHLIGNHTYSHVQLSKVSTQQAYDEIVKTNELIQQVTGETPKYIRPPYGAYSNSLLMQINMTPVLWSVDPDDWDTENTGKVVRSVVKNVKCGDIILLHDIYDSSVAAALEIVDQLKAKGYVFVTVDQLLLD